jgi:hypothetical protein
LASPNGKLRALSQLKPPEANYQPLLADTSDHKTFCPRPENLLPQTAKMVRTSVLNDALKSMNNAEKAGKRYVGAAHKLFLFEKVLTMVGF